MNPRAIAFLLVSLAVGTLIAGACAESSNTSSSSNTSQNTGGMGTAGDGTGALATGGDNTGAMNTGANNTGGNNTGGNNTGGNNTGGNNSGGNNTGGAGGGTGCTISSVDSACNMCLDSGCSSEKLACCAATGCVNLVNCAVNNCVSTQDISCVITFCSNEIAAAGGPSGAGVIAAQDLGFCAASACPNCGFGSGSGGGGGSMSSSVSTGVGGGGMGGNSGTGGGGIGGGMSSSVSTGSGGGSSGGVCNYQQLTTMCNSCLDNTCSMQEATCCQTTGCVGLVNCAVANCAPNDLNCVLTMCSNEIAAAGGISGAGTLAAQGLGNCAFGACVNDCP